MSLLLLYVSSEWIIEILFYWNREFCTHLQANVISILFIVMFFSYECYVLSIWILYVHFCWHSCSSVHVSRVTCQCAEMQRVSHLTSLHWHCHLIVTNASAGKWSYSKARSDVTLIDIIVASVLHLLSRHCLSLSRFGQISWLSSCDDHGDPGGGAEDRAGWVTASAPPGSEGSSSITPRTRTWGGGEFRHCHYVDCVLLF